MSDIPAISEAECVVMKMLWSKHPLAASDIVENLGPRMNWAPNTIRTLINRLVKKKAVRRERHGKEYHYYPVLTRAAYTKTKSDSFINQMFDGALMPMLTYFVKSKKLSQHEIESLKVLLENNGEN